MAVSQQFVEGKFQELKFRFPHAGNFCFFTDVDNLPPIFGAGALFSRNKAVEAGLLKSDCASPSVLGNTQPWVRDYVRLYFAPKTPMLYHVEGIKRSPDDWPECPIPVYLVFDPQVLILPEVKISDGNIGAEATTCEDVSPEFVTQLPFANIYHRGSTWLLNNREIILRRHAEVLVKSELRLEYLRRLVFRSQAEKDLGLALLEASRLVPCEVDRSWFNANRRPFLDVFKRTENEWSFHVANRWRGDTLVRVVSDGVDGITVERSIYSFPLTWSAFEVVERSQLDFSIVNDGKNRLYLNRHRVAEW
jgi:ssDNA thymidine ADP-ribosyltransferase, DarT